jgi:acetyltransferase-like isoleucine patch superfamily enzyme
MLRSITHYFFKKLAPIKYARHIGVKVGDNCRLMKVSFSTEPYLVTLGNHVSATNTRFETHDGGVWVLREKYPLIDVVKPISVGNNVFIGFGSMILPGVTIGDNVIIGAYSLVSKDIPSNVVAAGVPAKVIKPLDDYKNKAVAEYDKTKHFSARGKRLYYEDKFNGNQKSE